MELSTIRKAKREAENLIRQTLKEKIMLQEELDDRIVQLEQQVDRYVECDLCFIVEVVDSFITDWSVPSHEKVLTSNI